MGKRLVGGHERLRGCRLNRRTPNSSSMRETPRLTPEGGDAEQAAGHCHGGSGGGSDSFFSKLLTAAVLACGATLPAVIGVRLGRENAGYVASFGAYLVTITHADLPIEGRAPRLTSTIFMLCVGAIAGASAGQRVWIFLPLAVIAASWQAWTEIADTGLRFPAAIAVLTLLVSTANDSSNISIATYGAAFAGGAIWQGLVQYIAARPSDKPPASLGSDLKALIFSLARARQFIATMAALGTAGGAIASSLALPHAAWLLTTALRVMKPSQVETRLRLKHRFIGHVCGRARFCRFAWSGDSAAAVCGTFRHHADRHAVGWGPTLCRVDILSHCHCPRSRPTNPRSRLASRGISAAVDDRWPGSRQSLQFPLAINADCGGRDRPRCPAIELRKRSTISGKSS